MSPDKKIRFYTWNLPSADGTNSYYGFLQRKIDRNAIRVFQLTDKSADIARARHGRAFRKQMVWMSDLRYH